MTNPESEWLQNINAIKVISIGEQTILFKGINQYDVDGVLIDDDIAIANI